MPVESDSKLILKRSDQASVIPSVSDLEFGELALNYNDGRLFYKASDLTIKDLAYVPGANVFGNIDGGTPDSIYGGIAPVDGGVIA